jgi:hypothetical protein
VFFSILFLLVKEHESRGGTVPLLEFLFPAASSDLSLSKHSSPNFDHEINADVRAIPHQNHE